MENAKKILVINCGSSSLKYEVYLMPSQESLGKGLVERIGENEGHICQESAKGTYDLVTPIKDHQGAMELVAYALTDEKLGILANIDEIEGVGHRVVHGGEDYSESVIINEDVIASIDRNSELAPLHNPANLTGIRESTKLLPNVKQVAVFDTAFHQTLPPAAYLYGIPHEFYDKFKIRRYGFHGTSHRYVALKALEMCKRNASNTNIITCHLGNGASITSIMNGESVDTSMGFTPLAGLLMGTRSGDIDPSIVFFLMDRGYSSQDLNNILNKKSGLLGMTGISNDLRDIEAAAENNDERAIEALDAYAYRVRKYIGSYSANLVKVDILVFTGGVGQYGVKMRERICKRMQNIGVHIDVQKNKEVGGKAGVISEPYSPVTIVVMPTNEELQIASDAFELIF